MPPWLLQIILALMPVVIKLCDHIVPTMFSRKREFKTKKRMMKKLIDVHNMTVEQIAKLKK